MRAARTTLIAVILAALAAPVAGRKAAYYPYPPPARAKASFWEKVKSPHIDEINRLVQDALFLRQQIANNYWDPHLQPTRRQVLADALARYEKALELDPTRIDLHLEAGHTALEAAEYERAIAHYEAYRAEQSDHELLLRYNLAEANLRLRRYDDAASELENGLDRGIVGGMERIRYLTLLAYVYMAANRLDDATEACERALDAAKPMGGGVVDYMTLGVLAVALDRDEQVERAHEIIDAARAYDPQFRSYFDAQPVIATYMPSQRYYIPFSPAADKHYWLGLFYEAQGRYPEAVASWRAYLDSSDPIYARRASEHMQQDLKALADADKARREAKKKAKPAAAGGGGRP